MQTEAPLDSKEIFSSGERGELRDALTGGRIMIFSCSAYRAMCDHLFERFKSGAGIILYGMGEGYGEKLFRSISKFELRQEEAIAALSSLAEAAGWGIMNVKIIDVDSAECTVANSPFVLRRTDCGPTTCFFLSGIFASLGGQLMKGRFLSHEITCEANGSPICRFKLTRIE